MSDPIPLQTPAGFAPIVALGIDDGTGHLALVTAERPVPTYAAAAPPPPAPAALAGTTGTPRLAGPFQPVPGRAVMCDLAGDWQGTVRLLRSAPGSSEHRPVTLAGAPWARFTGNVCEPVWEEAEDGAALWLDCAITAGTLTYRVSQ